MGVRKKVDTGLDRWRDMFAINLRSKILALSLSRMATVM